MKKPWKFPGACLRQREAAPVTVYGTGLPEGVLLSGCEWAEAAGESVGVAGRWLQCKIHQE